MKVLHFYRTYFPDTQGGLEEAIRQICASTRQHGIESRILTLSPDPYPAVINTPEAQVYRAKLDIEIASCSMGWRTFAMFKQLADWADIIHYHFPWPFADVVKLISGTNKPSIVTYHSDIVRQRVLGKVYAPLMSRFFNGMSRIVATSPNYAQSSSVLKRYADKVEVIPLALNRHSYPPVAQARLHAMEQRFGQNFFLFIGVLRDYKGLHVLLEAAKAAPFKIVIVGIGPNDKGLKEIAGKLNLDNVEFTGYLDDNDKVALLNLCRAVVCPSHLRSEAFGLSLLEGAMMGKPLVSTELGTGTTYINIHNETGLVVPPGDVRALRTALLHLHNNKDMAALLGKRAQQRYEKLFTADLMGNAYASLYRKIAHALPAPECTLPEVNIEPLKKSQTRY